MAQLTEGEKVQFKAKGLWVKERCDNAEGQCRKAIGFLAWTGKSGKTYCSEACRDQQEGTHTVYRKGRQTVSGDVGADVKTYITRLMGRDLKKSWARRAVILECRHAGLGTKKEIRKGIRHMEADGLLLLDGKALRLASDRAIKAPGNSNRSTQARSGEAKHSKAASKGENSRRVRMRDVPVED